MAYYEIMSGIQSGQFVRYWDEKTATPFVYDSARKILVSYDDKSSLGKKLEVVKSRGLGGAFVWALDFDMFQTSPLARHDTNELSKHIKNNL